MLGGAVLAGRRSGQSTYRESDQEQRIEELETSQPACHSLRQATPVHPSNLVAVGLVAGFDAERELIF